MKVRKGLAGTVSTTLATKLNELAALGRLLQELVLVFYWAGLIFIGIVLITSIVAIVAIAVVLIVVLVIFVLVFVLLVFFALSIVAFNANVSCLFSILSSI